MSAASIQSSASHLIDCDALLSRVKQALLLALRNRGFCRFINGDSALSRRLVCLDRQLFLAEWACARLVRRRKAHHRPMPRRSIALCLRRQRGGEQLARGMPTHAPSRSSGPSERRCLGWMGCRTPRYNCRAAPSRTDHRSGDQTRDLPPPSRAPRSSRYRLIGHVPPMSSAPRCPCGDKSPSFGIDGIDRWVIFRPSAAAGLILLDALQLLAQRIAEHLLELIGVHPRRLTIGHARTLYQDCRPYTGCVYISDRDSGTALPATVIFLRQ